MQGFLPCFTSEVFWSRHLPSCLLHFKHRMVAAFAWTCIGFSYFHSLPHCPKNPPFWVANDSNMCLCFLALVLSLCLFHHIGLQGQKRRNLCKSLWSQKSKVICISASEIHWMELGKLWSHPQLTESFSCLLWIVQSVDILLTLLPFNLPFYITSILLLLGFPISIAGGFIPQLSQSLRNNAMHCSYFFSIPCPTWSLSHLCKHNWDNAKIKTTL